ncbi:hypothetical protein YH65_10515 [Sulfurovum lithotrophicum]|uniref:Uncharacterized protein n=1 Tax=Sulfurovum lithotrophicum TaxID=206403 RepID=A0A7U4RRF3_9BACT|nr:hypothetical protein [Sulfurovum lithotrophicum]AKF25770.1 hypothetical protein YH65_10515 [Sulfurovum lithotrophicum]
MRSITQLSLTLTALFLLTACGNESPERKIETFKNPVDTYMDSRVNAMDDAKAAVAESNRRNKEQEDAMKALVK